FRNGGEARVETTKPVVIQAMDGNRFWVNRYYASSVGANSTFSTVNSPSASTRESSRALAADLRSSKPALSWATCAAGAWISPESTSVRCLTLASDLALRIPESATPTSGSTAGSAPSTAEARCSVLGHWVRCTDPVRHQPQTSSVA